MAKKLKEIKELNIERPERAKLSEADSLRRMRGFGERRAKLVAAVTKRRAEIFADLHALEQQLLSFERRYGLRSETFYAAYIAGEEPDDDSWVLDFTEWASVYRTWQARQSKYRDVDVSSGDPAESV